MSVETAERKSSSVEDLLGNEQLLLSCVREAIPRPTQLRNSGDQLPNGNKLFIKYDCDTDIHAFKLRGAWVRMNALTDYERAQGVVTASAGNHAQGVAYAAARLGVRAHIIVPDGTPSKKLDGIKQHGGEWVKLIEMGESVEQGLAEAQRLADDRIMTLVHPYDDELVIAGQGTAGLELADQLGSGRATVIIPIGGGGYAAGVAAALKKKRPDVNVYGVQLQGADSAALSFYSGNRTRVKSLNKISDGTAVPIVGEITFPLLQKHLNGIITISESDLGEAYWKLLLHCQELAQVTNYPAYENTVPEPAGMLAEAAVGQLLRQHPEIHDQTIVAMRSGSNADPARIEHCLDAYHDNLSRRQSIRNMGTKVCSSMKPR